MATVNYTDAVETLNDDNVVVVASGVFIRLSNAVLGTFTSTAATDNTGRFTIAGTPPAGVYEILFSPDGNTWTDSGQQYTVPVTSGNFLVEYESEVAPPPAFPDHFTLNPAAGTTSAIEIDATNNFPQGVVVDGSHNGSLARPFVSKGSGTANYSRWSRYHYSDAILCGVDTFRKTRGTPEAPAAVAFGDHVAFYDFAAYDGGSVASADPDGIGYGGGVGEIHMDIDLAPPHAGSGHTPGRYIVGVTPRWGDPTGDVTIPALDPGPCDNFQMTSEGLIDLGAYSRVAQPPPGVLVSVAGDLWLSPLRTPDAPTVVATGNANSTHSFQYAIAPVGPGNVDGPPSPLSAPVSNDFSYVASTNFTYSANNATSTLAWHARGTTASQYNTVTPAHAEGMPGAIAYRLLVSVDGGPLQYVYTYHLGALGHIDDGSIAPSAYTATTLPVGGRVRAPRYLIDHQFATVPTVTVGAAAGTNGAAVLGQNSTDQAGYVVVTLGNPASTTTGPLCNITFGAAWPTTPFVVMSPSGLWSTPLQPVQGNISQTGFTISANIAPSTIDTRSQGSQVFFYYQVACTV